jgi:Holliday junction resolvase RusA-like endonuclease
VIKFTVEGIPTPQGSKTAIPGKNGGRPYVIDAGTSKSRKAHKAWRAAVTEAAVKWLEENPQPPLDEPCAIFMTLYFPRTADLYRTYHATTPDADKAARSVLDALTDAKLVVNDSRFCDVSVRKRYDRQQHAGADITVLPLGGQEAEHRELLKAQAKERRRQSLS